jgi:hypothetical protein
MAQGQALSPATAIRTIGGRPVTAAKDRSPHLNMLIYGDSGTGKTTLAGSADAVPSMRDVIIVDVEGGTESLKVPYPNVATVRVTSWKEMQSVYDDLHRGNHDYQTVIIDSLTEVQKFNMDQIMNELLQLKPDRDPDVPDRREWGKNLNQMRRFVRAFRDLPMNTIFTALVRADETNTGKKVYLPSLSGKLAGEVAAFLDIVGFYYTREVAAEDGDGTETARILLTQKTVSHVAKDRTRRLPQILRDPTMAGIFELIGTNSDVETTQE